MKDKILLYLLGAVALVSLVSIGIVAAFADTKGGDIDPMAKARAAKAAKAKAKAEVEEPEIIDESKNTDHGTKEDLHG